MVIVGVAVAAGLPVAGNLLRHSDEAFCSLDGEKINASFQVRIIDDQGRSHLFCCLRCAELWQRSQPDKPRAVYVTDEKSGQEIALRSAYFVRSRVSIPTTTGNRVHTFAKRSAAEKHAATFGGRLLKADEVPFH
jgi:hypothetical protein